MALRRLLLIRHGKAVAHHPSGDRQRELSSVGVDRIRKLLPVIEAKAFRADLGLRSPYARAVQTADLMGPAFSVGQWTDTLALVPEAHPLDLFGELKAWEAQGIASAVAFTHNPFVTELTQWLLEPRWKDDVVFHTPSLWALEFPGEFAPHQGCPLWILHP